MMIGMGMPISQRSTPRMVLVSVTGVTCFGNALADREFPPR
jgi:hypothetical protein